MTSPSFARETDTCNLGIASITGIAEELGKSIKIRSSHNI
jgi:hypothetical protein